MKQINSNQRIVSILEAMARIVGEKPAIEHPNGEIIYGDLFQLVSEIGSRLRRYVPKGSVIGILANVNPSSIAAMFGSLYANCTYVPIDPLSPFARIVTIIKQTGAYALIVSESQLSLLKNLGSKWRVKKMEGGLLIARPLDIHATSSTPEWRKDVAEPIATITFTSGSSGKPKSVLVPERALLNHVDSWRQLTEEAEREKFLLLSPLAFSLSMTAVYQSLLNGGTLVLPREGWQSNFRLVLDAITQHQVTCLKTIPALLELLVRHAPNDPGLRGLRLLTLSGEPAHWKQVELWRDSYPNTRLFNTYGMTEAFSFTAYEVQSSGKDQVGLLPLGSATEGNYVGVFDKSGSPCVSGQIGEILVRGKGEASGYLENGAFRPLNRKRVSGSDVEYIPTNDLGHIDGRGVIHFSGRKDWMVKVRGYRIDPEEIETHLQSHKSIVNAGVFKENAGDALVCLLDVRDDITLSELLEHIEARLPAYLVPTSFRIVSGLPRLSNGKVDRGRFPKTPGRELRRSPQTIKTKDEYELALVEIWNEFLPESQFGLDDDFTRVGGDSLQLLEMLLMIEQSLGAIIEESLGGQTIRSLADCVRRAKAKQSISLDAPASSLAVRQLAPISDLRELLVKSLSFKPIIRKKETNPLTVSQLHRLKKETKSKFDLTYVRIRFENSFDERALRLALAQLINTFNGLRGTIDFTGKTQTTLTIEGFANLPYLDGSRLSDVALDEQIASLGVMPIDLHDWPVFRWLLVKRNDCHEFIWQLSHTMIDLVSGDILAGRLIELYDDIAQGRAIRLVNASVTNSDFSREMDALIYPADVLEAIQDEIGSYFRAVDECKAGVRMQGAVDDGAFAKHLLEDAFDNPNVPPTLVLSAYARALSEWTKQTIVPLRVGTAARMYHALPSNFRHLVGQLNDHYLFTVDASVSLNQVAEQIDNKLRYFREHSVNFDKVLLFTEETDPTRYGKLPWSNFFSCGPLGSVSVRQNSAGDILTIPRPLWGEASFQPLSSGLKIGCYTFLYNNKTAAHVHAKGLQQEAFSRFVSIFDRVLKELQ